MEMVVQNLVSGEGRTRGDVLAAKGEEKHDHVPRVAEFPSFHVDLNPRFDGSLAVQSVKSLWKDHSDPRTHLTCPRS